VETEMWQRLHLPALLSWQLGYWALGCYLPPFRPATALSAECAQSADRPAGRQVASSLTPAPAEQNSPAV